MSQLVPQPLDMEAVPHHVVGGSGRRVLYRIVRTFHKYKAIAPFVDSRKREAYVVTGTGAGKTMALMHIGVGFALGEQGAAAALSGGEAGLVTIPGSEYWKLVLRPTLERYLSNVMVEAIDADTGDVIGHRRFAEIQTGRRTGDYMFSEDPRNGAFGIHLFPQRWSSCRGNPWGERTIWVKSRVDSQRMAGSNLAFVLHEELGIVTQNTTDEEVEKCVNNANERVRVKGPGGDTSIQRIRGVLTPECGVGHFFYSSIYEPWKTGQRPDVDIVQFSTLKSPYRSLPTIRSQMQAYRGQPHLMAAKIHGQFAELMEGRVFSNFDRAANVEAPRYDPDAPLYVSFDFNIEPHCTMLVFQPRSKPGSPRAWLHGLWERAEPNESPQKMAEMLAARYPTHRGDVHVFGDASDWNHFQNGFSYAMIVETLEKWFRVRPRWNKKNARLMPSIARTNFWFDHPHWGRMVRLSTDMPKTINACSLWSWDKGKFKDSRNPHKHFTDCLRYVCDREFPAPDVAGMRDDDAGERVVRV